MRVFDQRRVGRKNATTKVAASSSLSILWVLGLGFALLTLAWASAAKGSSIPDLNELEREVWSSSEDKLTQLESKAVRAVQINPRSVHAHMLLSLIYVRMFSHNPGDLGLLSSSSDLAQQAIDLDSKSDLGYVALATVLDTMGNSRRGLVLLDDAEKMGVSPSWRFYFTRSRLVSDEANSKEVLGLLRTALSFVDAEREIIIPYVVALLQTEKSGRELITEIEEWKKSFDSPLFDLTIATAYADEGQPERAHQIYQKILAYKPNQVEAMVNDAILSYQKLNQPNRSVEALQTVLATHNDLTPDVEAMINIHLGAALLNQDKFAMANPYFVAGAKIDPKNLSLLDFIVTRYKSKKAHKHLVDLIHQLNETTPGVSLLYALLGETLSEGLADHKTAIRAFTNAIALDSSRSDYYNGMGLTYYRMDLFDSALRLFAAATEIDPNDATARYNEACVLSIMKRRDEALISLGDAISLDPQLLDHARGDKDFKNIRETTQFQQLVLQPKPSQNSVGH